MHIDRWLKQLTIFKKKFLSVPKIFYSGHLVAFRGLILEVSGLKLPIGSICIIENYVNSKNIVKHIIEAEVVGFNKNVLFIVPFSDVEGLMLGSKVKPKLDNNQDYYINKYPISDKLLGRVLGSYGNPLDNLSEIDDKYKVFLKKSVVNPLDRAPISHILDTGIRSINALLTIGRGQKIGLFSSSGLGKSVLLSMMTKYTQADIVVLSLIGERNREIKEFIDSTFNKKVFDRSVVVAAPAEVSPLFQVKAATYAMSIAEFFRDKKFNVLLIMDSLTRYAMAYRELSLSIGELPVIKGYPPSVFSKLSTLVERVGNGKVESGSITAFFTVLTEEDEQFDPISSTARSILDGHIILSREYAESGHYPAINIETSISRVMPRIVNKLHYSQACYFKKLFSIYQKNKDIINLGAYVAGTNVDLDRAINLMPKFQKFLQQEIYDRSNFMNSIEELRELCS